MKNLPESDVTRQAWLEILSYSAASGFKPFKDTSVFSTTYYFWYILCLLLSFSKLKGTLLIMAVVEFIVVMLALEFADPYVWNLILL